MTKTFDKIQASLDKYTKLLERYNEEIFTQTPVPGVWSLSEVYSHILIANLLCMKAIDKCIEGKAEENGSGLNLMGLFVLSAKRFPPVKINAPERVKSMVKKVTRQEAINMIDENRAHLALFKDTIINASVSQRTKHPRLGNLNAKQWLLFIQIHSDHHLKQLARIQALLVN